MPTLNLSHFLGCDYFEENENTLLTLNIGNKEKQIKYVTSKF